jgi:hypothetical protein
MRRLDRHRVEAGLAALMAVLIVVEAVWVPHGKPAFFWHRLPGYAALTGLVSCLVVVVASKALGRMCLQRPEAADD